MIETKNELHKEFELERLILFSDAVFAIAITLIILEIKFPEIPKHSSALEILNDFKPTLIHFVAFVLSFLFYRHVMDAASANFSLSRQV